MSDADAPDITYGDDPTEAILSKSKLHKKWLCDYVINVATGCRHGCRFCYVPSTPQIRTRPGMLKEQADVDNPQKEWGNYVLHRDAERLSVELRRTLERKRTWKTTEGGRGIVALSFSTDCYQDRTTADATRTAIIELLRAGKSVRVLTRNPILALQDLDVFEWGADEGLITIGTSLPSLDADEVGAIEPRAPHPRSRLKGLAEFAEAGVPTFVSMSPTYPTLDDDLYYLRRTIRNHLPTLDVVFHEAINPRGGNFPMTVEAARDAGEHDLAAALESISGGDAWRTYALKHLRSAREAARSLDVPLKSWPGKDLVTATRGTDHEHWVRGEWMRPSPESFASDVDDL